MNKRESVRDAFGQKLAELALADKRVIALDGDLGNSTRLATVEKKAPDSFFQMGIAEQNMVGVAAGLATLDLHPWVCSFATFLTKRALDQIVVSVDQPKLNVILVGSYSGLLTSNTGKTHHSLDDIGLMRMLPNMTVIAPADATETRRAMEAIYDYRGPVYLRLSRAEDIENVTPDEPFDIDKGKILREGEDVAIITTGSMTYRAVKAAHLLQEQGVSVSILHVPTLKPIDRNNIVRMAKETPLLVTVEEHYIQGGLGSIVTEIITEEYPTRVVRIGICDEYSGCGKDMDLLHKHALSSEKIAERILNEWRERKRNETRSI